MSEAVHKRLPTGCYVISEAGNKLFTQVGRFPREDFSMNPKPVFNLPPGVRPLDPWVLIDQGKTYELKANGSPTGCYKGHVYAFLMEEPPAKWEITPAVTTEHEHGYIVEAECDGKRLGWVVDTEYRDDLRGQPIALKPLTPTKSKPPQYPPGQVFHFRGPLKEDGSVE